MRVMDGSSGSASLMGGPSVDLHHKGKEKEAPLEPEIDDEMYFELSDNESEISGDHGSSDEDSAKADISGKRERGIDKPVDLSQKRAKKLNSTKKK